MSQNSLIQIENFDVNLLPELQGMKEKQLQVVKDNPFVEIIDTKTYDQAKKHRTAFVSARTEIKNQDTLIAQKIKTFRTAVSSASEELIAITKPYEEKQQAEVKRWEEAREKEKLEKAKLEEERKNKIRNSINSLIDDALEKINKLSFDTIGSLKVDFEENLYKTDVSQFEEFELDFNEKLILLKNTFSSRIKTLEESEAQRLEKLRLEAEASKLAEEAARLKKIKEEQEATLRAERERMESEKAAQEKALKAKEDKAKKVREAAEAKLKQERDELEAEKSRLAKIEADKVAKEESERLEKEKVEQATKLIAEAAAKAKLEAERLEALKPEKQRAVEFLQSLEYSIPFIEITDAELRLELDKAMERIKDAISDSIFSIKNFK